MRLYLTIIPGIFRTRPAGNKTRKQKTAKKIFILSSDWPYSVHRYYFQHPYARLFVAYFVVFCNFLIFAEDPLSHSIQECSIPVLGNVISFVATKYPPEWQWVVVKCSLWVCAIFVGLVFGKYILHHIILRRMLRLKMFRDECGTWMIMFMTVFISCYFFSIAYNCLLVWGHPRAHLFVINTYMGMTYANFMKVAACGTWLGDFFTAWMITDMMLQDNLYPGMCEILSCLFNQLINYKFSLDCFPYHWIDLACFYLIIKFYFW